MIRKIYFNFGSNMIEYNFILISIILLFFIPFIQGQYHSFDMNLNNHNPYEVILTNNNLKHQKFGLVWDRLFLTSKIISQPYFTYNIQLHDNSNKDIIYIVTDNGEYSAIDMNNGNLIWKQFIGINTLGSKCILIPFEIATGIYIYI